MAVKAVKGVNETVSVWTTQEMRVTVTTEKVFIE